MEAIEYFDKYKNMFLTRKSVDEVVQIARDLYIELGKEIQERMKTRENAIFAAEIDLQNIKWNKIVDLFNNIGLDIFQKDAFLEIYMDLLRRQ